MLTGGPFQTNTYLLYDRDDGRAAVVDPGFLAAHVKERARTLGLHVAVVVVTHGHVDHVLGAGEFPGAAVYFPEGDRPLVRREWEGVRLEPPSGSLDLVEGTRVPLPGGREGTALATPGHSPASISLHLPTEGVVFSGDALFAGTIGRTDFPGGDFDTLIRSIRSRLLTLPDETRVLPGHGPETTIGRERRTNPFLI